MANIQPEIQTQNDFALCAGQNLPNHSTSMIGRGRFVRQGKSEVPIFRTKQDAYRYAAWLILLAEVHLPDDDGQENVTYEMVYDAISNV